MRPIPRFWERATTDVSTGGTTWPLRIWGWSTTSAADAAHRAQQRLALATERVLHGRGDFDYYPRSPLREEILHEVHADDGRLLGVVTRNRMGVDVLNTDAVLIADVDTPQPTVTRRLFRRGPADDPAAEAREHIARWSAANPHLGVRVYRTAAGFRVIVTGPTGEAPDVLTLEALGSDPVYTHLCAHHETYRARLTPKPHRIGLPRIPVTWPYSHDSDARLAHRWFSDYQRASAGHATCAVESATGPPPSPDEGRLLDLHDRVTLAASGLPLA